MAGEFASPQILNAIINPGGGQAVSRGIQSLGAGLGAMGQQRRQDQAGADKQKEDQEALFLSQATRIEDPELRSTFLQQGLAGGAIDQDDFDQISAIPFENQSAAIYDTFRLSGRESLIPKGQEGKVGSIRYVDTGNQIQARDTRNNQLLETIDKSTPAGKQRELDLRNTDIEIRTQERKDKIAQGKQDKIDSAQTSLNSVDRALSTVSQIIEAPGLESAVGLSSVLPTIPGSERADFEAIMEKFQGQQFLEGVQQMRGLGTLTETEGKKINQAAAALNANMSEQAFLREIDLINETLGKAKKRAERKLKSVGGKLTSSSAGLSDQELLNKYGL